MYCKYCGKEIPDNVKFCPVCGKAVNGIDSTQTNKQKEAQQTRSVAKGILLVVVLIIALLVTILGLINFSNALH